MRLLRWLLNRMRITSATRQNDKGVFSGYAVVKYDALLQRRYWETYSMDGQDGMSLSGGQPLPLNPQDLPLESRIDLYIPEPKDGK